MYEWKSVEVFVHQPSDTVELIRDVELDHAGSMLILMNPCRVTVRALDS